MWKLFLQGFLISGFTISINIFVLAQPYKELEGSNLQKTQGIQVFDRKLLDVNNISAWFRNDGEFYSYHATLGPGFEWAKGSGIHAIFSSSLWVGAKVFEPGVAESIRVATAGHFGTEYRPGIINPLSGLPDDYTKPEYKIYKVQPHIDNPNSNPDLLNWPIAQGAPWIDLNGDGKWNPYNDKPGIKMSNGYTIPDMILFYVYNDADSAFHTWIWGRSKPLAVEIRKTAWAYTSLPDVQFLRFEIHNKSKYAWKDTYITLWSDPDLGYAFDDYVGCDIGSDSRGKNQQLGYCYNGFDNDGFRGYGTKPPAVGFKFLQGPVVSGEQAETAVAFGRLLNGFKNIPLSSFLFSCNPGQGGCPPELRGPFEYVRTYKWMQGIFTFHYHDKSSITDCWKKPFSLDGDPVTDTGCVNSRLMSPSDLRMFMSSGPFNMAPNDSQDVIFASLIAQGSDRLNSITKLRELSTNIRNTYDNSFQNLPFLKLTSKFISSDSTSLSVRVKAQIAKGVKALFYREGDGLQKVFQLFDDGLHNDGAENDGVFGNSFTIYQSKIPGKVSLEIEQTNGEKIVWNDVATNITTAGPMEIVDFKIISDNLNADGRANPGENIRCLLGIKNLSRDTLANFAVSYYPLTDNIKSYKEQLPVVFNTKLIQNSGVFLDAAKYISFDISQNAVQENSEKILFKIVDSYLNVWYDTVEIKIHKPQFPPQEILSAQQTGEAEGAFGLRIINPEELKNLTYQISIEEIDTSKVFTLINETTGETVLLKHLLPDELGHNIPVTDGFKITRGTTTTNKGLKNWTYTPTSSDWYTGILGPMMDLLKDKRGFVTYPRIGTYTNIRSGLSIDSLRYVEIYFDRKNTQKAYRYITGFNIHPPRRIIHPEFRPFVIDTVGFGYLYQDYEKYRMGNIDSGYVVPFTVWEVDIKGNKLRQLNVGIAERNDSLYKWKKISLNDSVKEYIYRGSVDGRWNPSPLINVSNPWYFHFDGDEIILVFLSQYSDAAKLQYSQKQVDMRTKFSQLPLLYIVGMRRTSLESNFNDGDVLRINPYYPLRRGDVYSFNPVVLKEVVVPTNFRISQNYPNPFNAGTIIEYGLPVAGKVTIDIYNILGQKVAVLIDGEEKFEGNYTVNWDGMTTNNKLAASGVYLYRINVTGSQGSFAQTKKMVVLR